MVEDHQGLVRIAGEYHLVERLLFAALVLDHDAGILAVHLSDRPVEVNLVPEIGGQVIVDASCPLVPRLHGRGGFDIEELEIPRKESRRHIEYIGRHQEVDEHGLEYHVPEIAGQTGEVQDHPHADVVEWVECVDKFRPGVGQRTEPVNALQDFLKPGDLQLQFFPDVGVEIVGVDAAAVLDAVVEPGIDQVDAELLHQQDDVVVYGWNTGGDGNVEGNRAAVILRHVGCHRVSTQPVLGLVQPKIESVRVVMKRPSGPKTGNASADNGYAPRSAVRSLAGCHGFLSCLWIPFLPLRSVRFQPTA